MIQSEFVLICFRFADKMKHDVPKSFGVTRFIVLDENVFSGFKHINKGKSPIILINKDISYIHTTTPVRVPRLSILKS